MRVTTDPRTGPRHAGIEARFGRFSVGNLEMIAYSSAPV